ncbi:alpha-1,4-glucan--maltose-1-phosphate maltosyltransferase [Streptomyces rapamycinicus]|uniref:Alpha-1,4-glucan:maltose-1-phosphate maltosyltransferase n=2 Tax=Streptomyces rapamycinicus TaxID=1226757 RepID=A0A0A0NKM7_STRRN|nr:alpha-1,4-glucan--maltose-1-phosphate maltosyltransferase [Streptomyces rapamycinicus]AGP54900.1 alpha-1,4-glucan:maltose-1-phosphate maltosyltransferase [Streptomyces rapamycinicus NRRL 5491]MBB4782425.1 starch synthase (maltosyl-transferring) [Streptomyces rapamycinicus]RLV82091.1 alpha-1,4-glucan--maltose-1-phosphate maltosyltransferase [Streptomyces rapamycinicus NRRL 5491]UTO62935.1 alpha-1,4-glucan--maltose-1-phosphate maltosyltransferase [Streptomyces rapamycinicus]UTP30893.1 alpha-1
MIGRIPILDIRPLIDCGRRPAKAVVDETFEVSATVFREGHDAVNANVVLRDPSGRSGPWTPMRELTPGTDRWGAEVTPGAPGRWTYTVEAWSDPIATWRQHARIKVPAGIDTDLVLEEGARLHERAAAGVPKNDGREAVLAAVDGLRDERRPVADRLAAALAPDVTEALDRHPLRELVSSSRPMPLQVDRERALFGSWYELFPRSEGAKVSEGRRPVSGTLRTAAERLPAIAAAGFDVVYLPPIHPIGTAFRKGPNNTLSAGPFDVGSPWAIGSADGGHDAIHPDLGTFEDFGHFVARARELRMEVALDFALQCSPDHPWVSQHPEWFHRRADGTIAYAENPPKKYQDIYPLAFDRDFRGLVRETERVLRFWMAHGVRIFRVDNPHTKPVVFWEKVLGDIHRSDPDVLFLSEAFTRPAMLNALGAVGFHQSYTYFTWRNTKQELTDYLTELSGDAAAWMRPNFFVNTPDILHAYLQEGGRPAFEVRAVLAATLSPAWGVYAGYELCESTPVRQGGEEYLDSEKYQLRPRDWAAAEREGRTITPLLARLNRVRRRHPALRRLRNLRFHHADNDSVIVYSKRAGDSCVVTVVNLDPHHTQEATVSLNMPELGLEWHESVPVRDELTGETYHWGRDNYVRLEPGRDLAPAHVLSLRPSSPIGGSPTT